MTFLHRVIFIGAIAILLSPALLHAQEPKLTADQTDFFEKKIRPVFSENCYKCHSEDSEKVRGGLKLDSRDSLLKGGESGVVIVPGDPEKSLLIEAVRYTNKDLQMPPNDKPLPQEAVRDLEAWVKMGAPDPRTTRDDAHKYVVDFDEARKHWSFQPVKDPQPPSPPDPAHWVKTTIDAFVLAGLQSKGLTPSPPADKRTLIRRATFDLTGLPPTEQEVDDFVGDDSPGAFASVVDRLLLSPRYGERWGRFWLDLTHYSDTRGNSGGRDERYPYAYTYRDYVIRAFNEDLPYDQFLIQQIAADKLPANEDKKPLAAMGFLTLGNRFNNQMNDIIDDRIDILGKATMGLTLGCARCHDHKFDPIPTKDYYSLHGIFNSSTEPKEEPLIEIPKNQAAYRDFQSKYAAASAALKGFRDEQGRRLKSEMIGKSGGYMEVIHDFHAKTNDVSRDVFVNKRGLIPFIAGSWDNNLRNWERRHNPIFAPWIAFAQLSEADFSEKGKELAEKFCANNEKGKPINPLIAKLFSEPPASLSQLAARYAAVFEQVEGKWQDALSGCAARRMTSTNSIPDPASLPDPAEEEVRKMMYANGSPMLMDDNRLTQFINRDNKMRNKLNELDKAVDDLIVSHPGSPPRACVLEDLDKPRDSAVLIKGNPGNRGPVAPRHFLTILAGTNPPAFKDGSGRLELARLIASKGNPLTARVFVNRVWLHHFGDGIVRTPDDFGNRGENPSNPELLDYLASRFMGDGWSIKKLHRLIMLSSAYQESSEDNPRYEQVDPDNRFLWRMNRRRLDFESFRDTILFIGGDLDVTMGGQPVRLDSEPYATRRTIYGLVDRRSIPNMFQAFDFASPDLTTGRRESTVVPQQALFMMNSPLVVEQARNIIRRPDFRSQTNAETRISMLYEVIYQRKPTEVETQLALNYIHTDGATEWQTNAQSAWEYGYGEYDSTLHRAKRFFRFPSFANNRAWQADPKSQDARLKGMMLNADGGMPGRPFAVIRRWTSPRDGLISIDGQLKKQANGNEEIRGIIVSSRIGELGAWAAAKDQVQTQIPRLAVKRGETIDFITDCQGEPKNGAFKWAPDIRMETPLGIEMAGPVDWNAQRDFSGQYQVQRMNSWEKFAQVLLETNELPFVN